MTASGRDPPPLTLVPDYLTTADHPWLRGLLLERERFVGRPRREWSERLTLPLPWSAPRGKLRVAAGVLDAATGKPPRVDVAAARIREVVFRARVAASDRGSALDRAAATLGLEPSQLEAELFADLPSERPLAPLTEQLDPAGLAVAANGALVAGLLKRSSRLEVTVRGNSRGVVRHAQLVGLLCVAREGGASDAVRLELSGPLAVFRHTVVYGRALASLVPRLGWCNEYELLADCRLERDAPSVRYRVRSGDPLPVARELARHDSRLERAFERDFGRLAPDWELVREPIPLRAGEHLVFPDFELRHRHQLERRWLVEIAGFWSPEYLERKLEQLRLAGIDRLIVCIDEARAVDAEGVLKDARVLRYRRRIDARQVLAAVGEGPRAPAPGGRVGGRGRGGR